MTGNNDDVCSDRHTNDNNNDRINIDKSIMRLSRSRKALPSLAWQWGFLSLQKALKGWCSANKRKSHQPRRILQNVSLCKALN